MDGWLDLRRKRVAWLVGLVGWCPGKVGERALARCNTMGAPFGSNLTGRAGGLGGEKVVGKVCCTVLCKSQRLGPKEGPRES